MAENNNQRQQSLIPSVEVLKSQLLRQRSMAEGFRFPLTTEEAYRLLYTAYKAEVQLRGRILKTDAETTRVVAEVARFLTQKQGVLTGLMFCGTCGNGKTTLLRAIQNSLNWLSAHNALPSDYALQGYNEMTIKDAKQIANEMSRSDKSGRVKQIPVLAIEDMGREPAEVLDFGNVSNPIVDLIEDRYNSRLFTFITTNLTGKQIREKYGARVADRLNEMLHVVVFKNPTFR